MKCVHPISRRYVDLLGKSHSISCPCGKCVACLHNFQQQWFVRVLEHCKANPRFVYDTLTLAPENIQLACVPELNDCIGDVPKSWRRHLTHYVDKDGFYCAPFLDKSVVQKWIKRGRENYYNDFGERLNLSYFGVLEYGPKFSRPHIHILVWGVDADVYNKYFQKPWQQDFGYTCTKYLGYDDMLSGKTVSCLSRYLSKYVNKGAFESPFVKLGLSPKPYRLISKGIGAAYLNSSCFSYFKSAAAEFAKSVCIDVERTTLRCKLISSMRRKGKFAYCQLNGTSVTRRDVSRVRNAVDIGLCDGWLKEPSARDIRALSLYVHGGYMYILPRYYRSKLLNSYVPNYFQYKVQACLLENSRLLLNKALQEFAVKLGRYKVKFDEVSGPFAGFGRKLYRLLLDKYSLEQIRQAKAGAKGRYAELKNFYNRPLSLASCS